MTKIILTTEAELREIILVCLKGYFESQIPEKKTEGSRIIHGLQGLAEYFGVSKATAQKIKSSGNIRYRQIGRKIIFFEKEIDEDLKKCR